MIVRNLFPGLFERRTASLASIIEVSERAGWTSWAGVPVNEVRALQQLTVWTCTTLISDVISTLPVAAFRKIGEAPRPVSPGPRLLEKPHSLWRLIDWLGAGEMSLLLRGNFFGRVVERDPMQTPAQIEPMHPDEVTPRLRDGRLVWKVRGIRDPLERLDVLHIPGIRMPGMKSVLGLSPISYARHGIGLALATEEFGSRFFGDGAHPSGFLSSEAIVDDDVAKRMRAQFMLAHGDRHRKPAVLSAGVKWVALTINPDEAQFLETRRYSRSEICGFFRVPPHLAGDLERSTSWGTGIEEQTLGFIVFTLAPWLIRWEAALSELLPSPQYVKFNVAGLLRGRLLDRYRAYLMARQGGWLNVDEIRALEEMDPVPGGGGQKYSEPMNWGPLGAEPTGDGGPTEGERIARMLENLERRLDGHGAPALN